MAVAASGEQASPGAFQQAGWLRAAADRIAARYPAYRAEVIDGAIVVSPPRSARHNGIVSRIMMTLERQLPEERICLQTTSIENDDDSEDYAIPDLLVLPSAVEEEDEWLFTADIVDLALEVVSKGNATTDTVAKVHTYAEWMIPIFLLVDPRKGEIVLYSDPRDGAYQGVHRLKFGDPVALPEPLSGVSIDTAKLPRYGTTGT
nr:Uma2 family endonuclease [Murinocardiopsis flavida]